MIYTKDLAFRLSGGAATYAFHIDQTGKVIHDYFGPALRDEVPLESLSKKMPTPGGTSVVYDEKKDPSLNLDLAELEFSLLGKGDFASPSLIIYEEANGYVHDFVYQGYEIASALPLADGLPTPHGKIETLIIHLLDVRKELGLDLVYGVEKATGTICRTCILRNLTDSKTFYLERAASLSLDFYLRDPELITLQGAWAAEANMVKEKIRPGRKIFASHMGCSSNRVNPFFVVKEHEAGLFSGDVYSFNLVYSSSHFFSVERTPKGKLRILSGIDDEGFRLPLKPGGRFIPPYATLSFSQDGLNGLMAVNHRFVENAILPERFLEEERKVLLNNWEATYFDFTESKIIALARDAKKLGIELFVLDDGWFKGRNDDHTSLGDYEVDRKKLPHGLKGLAEKINGLGLQFGLWVEPEAVSEDSDLYRAHPDWAVKSPGLTPSVSRHEYLLDLSRKEVVDHVLEELTAVLSSAPISYIKWDMNRPMSDFPASPAYCLSYAKGLYRLLSEITRRFPEVYFQGCASGGNRFDLGILSYFPEIWASDNTDPFSRLVIQSGLALGYPMRTMGSHVSASPNHQTLRKTPMATRFDEAVFGGFGYELSSKELKPRDRSEMEKEIAYYKEHRSLFQNGRFVLLSLPGASTMDWEVIAEDGSEAAIASFRFAHDPIPAPSFLRGAFFESGALYELQSRPFELDLGTFGGLVNQVAPFHLNPEGLLFDLISRYKTQPADEERLLVSGSMLNTGRVPLHEEWNGTGLNPEVKVRGEGGSRLYYIRKK